MSFSSTLPGMADSLPAAVFACNSFLACVAPNLIFYIYAIVPVPAWLFVSGVFAFDLWTGLTDRKTTTDSAGHVSGILAGIFYFLFGL